MNGRSMVTVGRWPIRHGTNGDQLNFPVVIALGSDDAFLKALHVQPERSGTGNAKGVEPIVGSDRNLKGM